MIVLNDYEYKLIKKYDSCSGITGKSTEIIAVGKKEELKIYMKDNKMKNSDYTNYSYLIIPVRF